MIPAQGELIGASKEPSPATNGPDRAPPGKGTERTDMLIGGEPTGPKPGSPIEQVIVTATETTFKALSSVAQKIIQLLAGEGAKDTFAELERLSGDLAAACDGADVAPRVTNYFNQLNAYYLGRMLLAFAQQSEALQSAAASYAKSRNAQSSENLANTISKALDTMQSAADSFAKDMESASALYNKIKGQCATRGFAGIHIQPSTSVLEELSSVSTLQLHANPSIPVTGTRSINVSGMTMVGGIHALPHMLTTLPSTAGINVGLG